MNAEFDPAYLEYLTKRDEERRQAVDAALAKLTPRELALVREAAVMGYVQGVQSTGFLGPLGAKIPADSEILRITMQDIPFIHDKFPALAALFDEGGET